jgi:hypothetical protein
MSKLPNYSSCFFPRLVGEGERWFAVDSTWLIHYKNTEIPSNSVLQLYSFDSGYSLVILGKVFWLERFRYYKNKFPKHSFPFFYYHKINFHLDISIFEQLFLLCFLKYESFSNWQQSYYRNIGYFEEIYTCENLTFHLQNWKRCKFVNEMVCLHNA